LSGDLKGFGKDDQKSRKPEEEKLKRFVDFGPQNAEERQCKNK